MAENKLHSMNKNTIELGLDNMKKIMELLGRPDRNYKIIHIAGTNGKGSTAAFLESVLLEAGYKTGKYTSPEIYKFNERISVNKTEIDDAEVDIYYNEVNKIISKNNLKLTYFEVTTAMMFLYMKDKKVDYLVLETGLGGKSDATNIVTPVVSLITNVSFDHINFLGDTLEKIANEKAGIIKKEVPVFFSDNTPELSKEIKKRTNNYVNVLKKYNIKTELDKKNLKTIVEIENEKFVLSLFGKFQAKNFLLMYETAKYLGIEDEVIKKGCLNVIWKGRFQVVSKKPFIILDGAHNEASAKELSKNLTELFPDRDIVFIISILKDKDNHAVLKELAKSSDYAVFTGIDNERGQSFDVMYLSGKKYFKFSYYGKSLNISLEKAKLMDKKAIVICGSFYLLKEYEDQNK